MSEVQLRQATTDDVAGILDTLKLALGETPTLRRTPELWNWKHQANPFGRSIVFVASDGATIAGVRALMRWNLVWRDDLVRCVRAVDTATHPKYRRQGIFRSLTELALDAATEDGVNLVFNTPNEQSSPGYLEMGWSRVAQVGVQLRLRLGRAESSDPLAAPAMTRLAPGFAPIGEMPSEFEEGPAGGLRTPRSDRYLTWRFHQHPTASYGWLEDSSRSGMVGRASTRNGRSELVVSDLFGSPRPSVIGRAARSARSRYLAGWFSPASSKRRVAIRGGLLPIPGVRSLQLVARPLSDLPMNPLTLDTWDIATSDLELL
jgi:N-acetylglutamate synthase-like GNAT family acetyltransferase